VHDLVQLDPDGGRWDFELLKVGRHVRLNERTKVILGRREEENRWLEEHFTRSESRAAALMIPANFNGPTGLIVGEANDSVVELAGGLMLRYARGGEAQPRARFRTKIGEHEIEIGRRAHVEAAVPL
jgi:hypothetical protein